MTVMPGEPVSIGCMVIVTPGATVAPDSGVNSGFMMAQVTAAALVAENRMLCHPASIDSIPTSANQEDHVSMATHGARRLGAMTTNALNIVAVEFLAACQGLDLRAPLKTSALLQRAYGALRLQVPFAPVDRLLAPDIEAAALTARLAELIVLTSFRHQRFPLRFTFALMTVA